MAWVTWEPIRRQLCDRVGEEVALEAKLVYPAAHLPESPPRVLAHRCSHWADCNSMEGQACIWAGTHAEYDPFQFASAD